MQSPKAESPRPLELFVVWMKASAQAVGGGGSGQLGAYNAVVTSRGWFSPEAWAECWGICQIVPGVNIIGMALLTGSRLAGFSGAGASLAGLVAPNVVLTLLLTALYTHVQGTPLLQAGLHGLMAAAAAASFLSSWRLARPVVRATAAQGRAALGVAVLILLAAAVLVRTTDVPVFGLLLAGGCAMAATQVVVGHMKRNQDHS